MKNNIANNYDVINVDRVTLAGLIPRSLGTERIIKGYIGLRHCIACWGVWIVGNSQDVIELGIFLGGSTKKLDPYERKEWRSSRLNGFYGFSKKTLLLFYGKGSVDMTAPSCSLPRCPYSSTKKKFQLSKVHVVACSDQSQMLITVYIFFSFRLDRDRRSPLTFPNLLFTERLIIIQKKRGFFSCIKGGIWWRLRRNIKSFVTARRGELGNVCINWTVHSASRGRRAACFVGPAPLPASGTVFCREKHAT